VPNDAGRDVRALDGALRAVKVHKEEAKMYRDDGDIDGAVDVLREAVDLLLQVAPDADRGALTDAEKQIAWNLADCLGMLGGNYRRLGRLDDALRCFEEGRSWEEDERFGIDSTYNLVNAITLPIEMRARTATEQRHSLEKAVHALERGTNGARRLDRWAWADLGQSALLQGDLDRAFQAYRRFRELGDAASVASHVTVLKRLIEALADRDPLATDALQRGISFLERNGSES
jgi:tetratricopeptide (TPR) repeat protein